VQKQWCCLARRNCVQHNLRSQSFTGILVAAIVVTIWIVSLIFFCAVEIDRATSLWILPGILGRTFIQTGLFIVAHDAIHGSVFADNRRFNDSIGRLAVTLFAFLDYHKLTINHWQHHRHPGQAEDPDFYTDFDGNILVWYLKFMQGYINIKQIVIQLIGLGSALIVMYFGLHIPLLNLFLFWVMPIFLSTMQLFFFGTYLPHRPGNAANLHCATSSYFHPIVSFFTCYHFGYHWEHHEYPWLPWYSLPAARQCLLPKLQTIVDVGNPSIVGLMRMSPLLTLLLLAVD
jgi:beta-carotene/zeaxanthin 4-ketolase